jgi:phosphonate transport system substrate-binding protein
LIVVNQEKIVMNRRNFLKTTAAGAGSALVVSIAAQAPAYAINLNQSPTEFKLGLFAGSDSEQTKKNVEPFRTYMEKTLGIPVTVQTGTSYTAVIEALRGKFVDAMEVGPFAYVLASSQTKVDPLAVNITPSVPKGGTAVYDAKTPPYYFSVIFTKKSSGIKTLADLKGKKFSFVDPASTSGNLMPRTVMLKAKIDPEKDFAQAIFAGSHPASVTAVWNDKVDAGATFEDNLFTLNNSGQVEACVFVDGQTRRRTPAEIAAQYNTCGNNQLVIIAYSDPIPNTPFGIRSDTPAQFKTAVKSALLKVREDAALVGAYKQWYVDPVKEYPTLKLKSIDSFYGVLRDAARLLKLDLTKFK